MGQEALGCINGLLPRFVSLDKTSRVTSTRKPFTTPAVGLAIAGGDCLLTPAAIIHWFIVQVLHGNTALEHISLLSNRAFTDSAYCQARANLPLRVYRAVLHALNKALVPDTRLRVFGSAVIVPSWLMARRFPCLIHPSYKPTSASREIRNPDVGSLWRVS